MAFNFQVIRGSTTYTLYGDGQPIRLESVDDLGGAGVRNIEESGPYQDGATHLDYRLEPATLTLRFVAVGASASALDGHRDTLNEIFKPVRGVPITLKVTRDDGEVRQLDCQRAGRLAIPLVKTDKPGNVHRAVVQLRAADPLWYDPVEQSETLISDAEEWWLAGGQIGTANVLEHVESPTQGQSWSLAGSVGTGNPWSIAFRTGTVNPGVDTKYAFDLDTTNARVAFYSFDSGGIGYGMDGGTFGGNMQVSGGTLMAAGTLSYFAVNNGGTLSFYRGTALMGQDTTGTGARIVAGGRWRSDVANTSSARWAEEIPFAAIYNVALGTAQIFSLNLAMGGFGTAFSFPIAYEGNYESFPVIEITGPLSDPVITNSVTGKTLNFVGGTVDEGDVWTIDTRYGRKSVTNGAGSSVLNYLSDDSDLATFSLVPSPLAAGGTNTLTVTGANSGTATDIEMTYYNRYLSY